MYSKKLSNGISIISHIRKSPGISTEKLAELLEVSVRTVQRYIAALQAAGEWIEYDRKRKRWILHDGMSVLFGDPF